MTVHINSLMPSLPVSALWRASWQGAVALLLIGLICRVFARRLPADVHCWLWRLGYVRLLLSLAVSEAILVPLLSPAPRPLPTMQSPVVSSALPAPAAESSAVTQKPSQTAAVQAAPKPALRWKAGLALAYGLGLTLCLSRLLLAAGRTRRILRSAAFETAGPNTALAAALAGQIGLHRVPPLAWSAAIDSPVYVAGTVLLPAGTRYEEADLRMILAHELAHAKRRDLLWEWLGTLVQVAFFFHPLVVLARREERLAREAAADALAIQATEAHAADYGKLLLSLSLRQNGTRPALVGAVGVIEGGSLLRRRLLALRDGAGRTNTIRTRRVAFVLVPLIALVFVPWKITHGQAPPPAMASAPDAPDTAPKMPAGNKRIAGIVVDEKGKPVAGISINLTWYWSRTLNGEHSSGSRPLPPVFTDAQGRFKFSGLPSGKFQYGVHSQPEYYVPMLYPLTLRDNETTKTLRIVVSAGCTVVGRVVDGLTGRPLPGIYVGAGSIPPGGNLSRWNFWKIPHVNYTNAEGRYHVRVMPGAAFVGVGRITDQSLASHRVSPSVREVIAVKDQTVVAPDLPVFLCPLFVCVEPDGQPAANATVHIVPADMPKYHSTLDDRTNNTGTIVLDRIDAGMFSIAQGSHHASGTYRWSPGQPLVVTMNGETRSYLDGVATIPLTESNTADVTGAAVNAEGQRIANALISIYKVNPKNSNLLETYQFKTDGFGVFHAPLDPTGTYQIYARKDGYNQVRVAKQMPPLVQGASTDLGLIHLTHALGSISGRLIDSTGRPMAGALAYAEGGKTFLSGAVTDTQGRFHIPNVVVGEALRLVLYSKGTVTDSGGYARQTNSKMEITGVEASPTEREIVWKTHT